MLFISIDSSRSHFNRLPYEIVKPILDVATPDQLYRIIDNNPVCEKRLFMNRMIVLFLGLL